MDVNRKVAAILHADVVGYSRLMGQDELGTVADMIDTRRLVAASVGEHGGRLGAVGDAMLADFGSAAQALQCAVQVQRQLAERHAARPAGRRMLLRIGLNLGDIIEQDSDLYGDAINIAARLQALAEPGGVCVSSAIHDLVDGKLPVAFRYAGEQSVKNIARPLRVYHVELGPALREPASPPPDAGRQGSPGPASQLPRPLSSFVGRAREIDAAQALLGQHRLVTLVGPGGVGKTRLSIHVAHNLAPRYPGGMAFVELAPVADGARVVQAIADALEVQEDAGRPLLQAVQHAIGERRLLLVLDNCEHLVAACADVVWRLLAAAPHLQVLASSREPLHITGEVAFPVPPLALPDAATLPPEALARYEAPRLFVERARNRLPGFELDASNAAHVVRICRRLDGIALAIELAAARVHSLSVEQIAARLDDRFRLLVSNHRDAVPRQQTLRALIDWSHDLLSAPDRVLLRRLAVFAGGCTLQAAEDVASGDGIARDDVLDALARLVDKSLVQMDSGGRYRLLETVKEYAWEHLERSEDRVPARQRHLAHFVALAEEARAHLTGADGKAWLERLDAEVDDIQAAHAASLQLPGAGEPGLRLVVALKMWFFNRGRVTALLDGIVASLAHAGAAADPALLCRALHTAGQVTYHMGRFDESANHLDRALGLARETGDEARMAAVLKELGMAYVGRGRLEEAKPLLAEALEITRRQPDRRSLAATLNEVAQLHRLCGELDAAEPLYEQALAILQAVGDQESTAALVLNLAMVSLARGQGGRTRELLLQAHAIALALGSRPLGQCTLAVASGLAALGSEWDRVPQLAGAASSQASQSGVQLEPADRACLAPLWQRARDSLGAQAYAHAEARAAGAAYEDAMREAGAWLAGKEPVSP